MARVRGIVFATLCGLSWPAPSWSQLSGDATTYPVSEIRVEYRFDFPDQAPLSDLGNLAIALGEDPDRWTVPSASRPIRKVRIGDIGRVGPVAVDRGALVEICTAVVKEMQRRNRSAKCSPSPEDIVHGRDMRGERRALRLQVTLARVRGVNIYATGARRLDPTAGAVNHPAQSRLREAAPVALPGVGAAPAGDTPQLAALLDVAAWNEYVARLNRHPGRSVALITTRGSSLDGAVTQEVIVTENRPLSMYFQTTDTGTDETGRYRNRIGLTDTELTGHDDVLQIEYLTSDFEQIQAASASYEGPVPGLRYARFKLFASMSEFKNGDVGIARADFAGSRSEVGVRVVANLLQRGSFFLDGSLGLRAERLSVDDSFRRESASDRFLLPSIGLRIERRTPLSVMLGGFEIEQNLPGLAGTDAKHVNRREVFDRAGGLGRDNIDDDFGTLHFDLSGSTFLEPWLAGASWSDLSIPRDATLAHEIAVRLSGQYSFGTRLVPQEEAIAGGRDTVRGYDQAVAVGDSVYLASLEYRYHFPRSLTPRPAAPIPAWARRVGLRKETFRYAPEQPAGSADWDAVLKVFVDSARVHQSDRVSFESDKTLVGAGVGLEISLWQNFAVALDVGFPLTSGHTLDVERGRPVLHFSLTALY